MAAQVRRISGFVVLPPECPRTTARIVVELRDVTYLDAAAPLVAEVVTTGVAIGPGVRWPFTVDAPAGTGLGLACHVDLAGDGVLVTGDLVSVQAVPVPAQGAVSDMSIPVRTV
ncbi:hypothetical protein [Nocardia sp. NPDC051833]|uniref:hypothetical protein n=1 Tax=Nocardia sp. NPDC051833 TaxID=3155674 RepID=UPI00341F0098